MTTAKHIENIDRQLQQLKEQRMQLLKAEKWAARKRRDRQCYVVGGYLMRHMPKIIEEIKVKLERKQDRDAFGLPPLEDQRQDLSAFRRADVPLPLDEEPAFPNQGNSVSG